MGRGLPAWSLVLTIAIAAACGNRDERRREARPAPPPVPAPDTAAAIERDEPDTLFVAVELPEAFPADFPIAPESTIVEARSSVDDHGVLSRIALVGHGEPAPLVEWYRDALEAAGWQVTPGTAPGAAQTLHATQVESYIDLVVQPHPAGGAWILTTADIWKTGR